jgi:hypothetical protein
VRPTGTSRAGRHLLKNYTKKFFLVIHHEPENEVIDTPGSGPWSTLAGRSIFHRPGS